MKTRIVMVGAKGRMGEAIIRLARAGSEFEVVGEVEMGQEVSWFLKEADAVIDFSHHSASLAIAQAAAKAGKALVIGTTGHDTAAKEKILAFGGEIPLVFSPNYSIGVNTLFYVTRKTAEILGGGFDQEVIEMHHRFKKDAPSGTARRLAEILCEVKGRPYDELVRDGRSGEPGERTRDEIGVHALRGGDVVGDHTVVFAAPGERVELTHKASSRDTFAAGALRAAAWLKDRRPGVYSMFNVLGLE
jgi:4-hydroxy-tetrahydrodipicolinate reductase